MDVKDSSPVDALGSLFLLTADDGDLDVSLSARDHPLGFVDERVGQYLLAHRRCDRFEKGTLFRDPVSRLRKETFWNERHQSHYFGVI